MKFLYLILLTTATFCYDSELLNYPEVLKAKYQMFDVIKKFAYSNPMPDNYKDYLNTLEFSGNFFFDIIPIDNWEQESKKILLLADVEGKDDLLSSLKVAKFAVNSGFSRKIAEVASSFLSMVKSHTFQSHKVTTSKGKFIMFYYIKRMTVSVPKKESGKVKVCHTTNSIFKKCAEYEINEAVKKTAQAFLYSKIKEKMDDYY